MPRRSRKGSDDEWEGPKQRDKKPKEKPIKETSDDEWDEDESPAKQRLWDTRDHLVIDDVMPLLTSPTDVDSDLAAYLKENLIFQMNHKLTRINQGLAAILEKWPDVTPLQVYVAFDLANCCIDDLVDKLDCVSFRQSVNNELGRRLETGCSTAPAPVQHESDPSSDDDGDRDFGHTKTPRLPPQPRPTGEKRKRWSKKDPIDVSLIPPAPPTVSWDEWKTWSDVRRRSYLQQENDPNAYLYRNPPLGVPHKNGPWTSEEKTKFLERVREVRGNKPTIDGRWGIFSLAVPGRVGYQCSNFYRQLIAAGEIQDANYQMGSDGKLHHVAFMEGGRAALSRKKKFGKKGNVKGGEPKLLSRYEQWAAMNPMPEAMDPLTGEKMRVPTMSPDGYVFDYTSWMKTKKADCINPYTRDVVKKRDLIVLTHENFDDFKDKIRSINA
jgi:hypothetical protein